MCVQNCARHGAQRRCSLLCGFDLTAACTPLALVGSTVKRGQSTTSTGQVMGTTVLAVGRAGVVVCRCTSVSVVVAVVRMIAEGAEGPEAGPGPGT